jgi:DNA-binding LacI/PurR family transcriptional regulator
VRTEDFTRPAGNRMVDELGSAGTTCDALFCVNDLRARSTGDPSG